MMASPSAIYQRHAPANADVAWFWSVTEYVEPRSGLSTSGMAETLDAAKAAFRERDLTLALADPYIGNVA